MAELPVLSVIHSTEMPRKVSKSFSHLAILMIDQVSTRNILVFEVLVIALQSAIIQDSGENFAFVCSIFINRYSL